jgi:hypothetical protein
VKLSVVYTKAIIICQRRVFIWDRFSHHFFKPKVIVLYFFLLFICMYNVWVISPLPLPPTPSLPGRNYFALISNFVEERISAIIGRNKGFCWLR